MVYTCNYTLTVTATSASGESQEVTITDMRIGEVWVCSGQSNMRFQVRQVRKPSLQLHRQIKFFLPKPNSSVSLEKILLIDININPYLGP